MSFNSLKHSFSLTELPEFRNSPSPNLPPGFSNNKITSSNNNSHVPPLPGTSLGIQSWLNQQSHSNQNNQHQHKDNIQYHTTIPSSVSNEPKLYNNNPQMNKMAVFWDFENCPPPSGMPGYVVVENIRNVIHHFGHVTQFKAYLEINENNQSKKGLRSELQSSGVSLTDCPHNGRKDAADKMMIVDMLAFAIDNEPPATIVLISGDKDFVYALSTLRNRKFFIVLIVPNQGASIILKSQASVVLEWRYDVLNEEIWKHQQFEVHTALKNSPGSISSTSNTSSNQISPMNNKNIPITQPPSIANSSADPSPLSTTDDGNNEDKQLKKPDVANLKVEITTNENKKNTFAKAEEYICLTPQAPGYFDLLIEVLETFRLSGDNKPRRSKVGNEISRRNPLLYHRAGCSSFKEYVELSHKEGIVSIGGEKGLAWISLNENYRDKLFKTESF